MLSRRVSLVVAGLLIAGLTGCTPAPAPTPSPTGFASEDEAFDAAEELYRAHVQALNGYHAGQEDYTSEDYLSGEPLNEERAVLQEMKERDLRVEGELVVASLERVSASAVENAWSVTLASCLDSSQTRIVDRQGNDVTPERDETIALLVEVATVEPDRLAIVKSTVDEASEC